MVVQVTVCLLVDALVAAEAPAAILLWEFLIRCCTSMLALQFLCVQLLAVLQALQAAPAARLRQQVVLVISLGI